MLRRGVWLAMLLTISPAAWGDGGTVFNGTNEGGPLMFVPSSLTTLSDRQGHYSVQPFFPGPENVSGNCSIFSVQTGLAAGGGQPDSDILLYDGPPDPLHPLDNLKAFNDNAQFSQPGTSRIENTPLSWSLDWYVVTVSHTPDTASAYLNLIQCKSPIQSVLPGNGQLFFLDTGITAYDGTVVEVQNGRFQISVYWVNFDDEAGSGHAAPSGSSDSAIFWFFHPQNWEMLVKVIDGCDFNDHYWVYMSATTNVQFAVHIRDTRNTPTREDDVFYLIENELGSSANSKRQDINAFDTCQPPPP